MHFAGKESGMMPANAETQPEQERAGNQNLSPSQLPIWTQQTGTCPFPALTYISLGWHKNKQTTLRGADRPLMVSPESAGRAWILQHSDTETRNGLSSLFSSLQKPRFQPEAKSAFEDQSLSPTTVRGNHFWKLHVQFRLKQLFGRSTLSSFFNHPLNPFNCLPFT